MTTSRDPSGGAGHGTASTPGAKHRAELDPPPSKNGPAVTGEGERTPADFAVEFGGYLAGAVEAFLDYLNEAHVFADITDVAMLDALRDHRRGLRLAIHDFDKRADRYRSPPPTEAVVGMASRDHAPDTCAATLRGAAPDHGDDL